MVLSCLVLCRLSHVLSLVLSCHGFCLVLSPFMSCHVPCPVLCPVRCSVLSHVPFPVLCPVLSCPVLSGPLSCPLSRHVPCPVRCPFLSCPLSGPVPCHVPSCPVLWEVPRAVPRTAPKRSSKGSPKESPKGSPKGSVPIYRTHIGALYICIYGDLYRVPIYIYIGPYSHTSLGGRVRKALSHSPFTHATLSPLA